MKEEALLAAAKSDNEHQAREQECEAGWYAGAMRLLDGDAAGAKPLLERSVATDVRNFIEYGSAKMALAAMR
jgi:lipoprotein NlpI